MFGSIGGAVLDIVGGERDRQASRRMHTLNRRDAAQARDQQAEFFRTSMNETIQRRVADARAAGISPLAALGVPGTSVPSVPSSPGNVGDPGSGHIFRSLANLARDLQRTEIEKGKAAAAKTVAETNNVRLQTALAQQKLAERKLQMFGRTAEAEAAATGPTIPRIPRYAVAYDNTTGYVTKDGEVIVTNPELAESLEGAGNIGHGMYGEAKGRLQQWGKIRDMLLQSVEEYLQSGIQAFPLDFGSTPKGSPFGESGGW